MMSYSVLQRASRTSASGRIPLAEALIASVTNDVSSVLRLLRERKTLVMDVSSSFAIATEVLLKRMQASSKTISSEQNVLGSLSSSNIYFGVGRTTLP